MLSILVFAGLAETVGGSKAVIEAEAPISVAELKRKFAEVYPAAEGQLATCFAAINQAYAEDDAIIHEGDEIALLPPVSGG